MKRLRLHIAATIRLTPQQYSRTQMRISKLCGTARTLFSERFTGDGSHLNDLLDCLEHINQIARRARACRSTKAKGDE